MRDFYAGLPVLVTGAAGFVGRLMCRRLLELGAEVHGQARRSLPPEVRPHRAELAEIGAVVQSARPRVIFHLAACLERRFTPEVAARCTRDNLEATCRLLEAARGCVVVCAGTGDEYGRAEPPFREDTPLAPLTPYSASKGAASLWALGAAPSLQVEVIWARLFMLYGPGMSEDFFLARLFQAARTGVSLPMTEGKQSRDFTWALDAVESMLRLAATPGTAGQAFNVCTGIETPLLDAVREVETALGKPVPVAVGALPEREGEIHRLFGDPSRLREATGYAPSTTLAEGLRQLL